MDTPQANPHRKPYAKPAVEEVRLRVSEAVLGLVCRATFSGQFAQRNIDVCTFGSEQCQAN